MCKKRALKVGVLLSNGQVKYGESLKAFVLYYLSLSLSCAMLYYSVYITHFNAFERLYNGIFVSFGS